MYGAVSLVDLKNGGLFGDYKPGDFSRIVEENKKAMEQRANNRYTSIHIQIFHKGYSKFYESHFLSTRVDQFPLAMFFLKAALGVSKAMDWITSKLSPLEMEPHTDCGNITAGGGIMTYKEIIDAIKENPLVKPFLSKKDS